MSKVSRRPQREEIKAKLKERKRAQKELRRNQEAQGLPRESHTTISNGKSSYKSVEEERLVATRLHGNF